MDAINLFSLVSNEATYPCRRELVSGGAALIACRFQQSDLSLSPGVPITVEQRIVLQDGFQRSDLSLSPGDKYGRYLAEIWLFPTKRLIPVAGRVTRSRKLGNCIYVSNEATYPYRREESVAEALHSLSLFPTKRLIPVAKRIFHSRAMSLKIGRFQRSDLSLSPGAEGTTNRG